MTTRKVVEYCQHWPGKGRHALCPSNASGTAHTVGLDWTNHWIAASTPYEYLWKIPPPEMKHKSINMSSLTAQ